MWYNLYISRESLILVKQKEKEKLFFGNKSAKRLAFLVVFLVCGFFIFNFNSFDFNLNKAQAQTETEKKCTDEDMESLRKECKCTSQDCRPDRSIANRYDTDYYTAEEIAILRCYNTSVEKKCGETIATDVQLGQGVSNHDVEAYREEVKKASSSACSGFGDVGCWLLWAFNSLLYGIFKLMGAIVVIAGNIFDWTINADNFNTVMNISAINQGWQMVRDFLNLFFILVLLFSAFCTIFQVTKYHIKTILLNLVIMALLVNFSFPISRVIIDAGNIPMYYFFQAIGGNGTGSIGKMLWDDANGNAGLQMFLLPSITSSNAVNGQSDQTFSLIAAIIFIFLFGITLLVIAVLFLIRMLVLAILIIFSPVGFVAAIFPGFSKYSSSWWEQLFKQSFFGTVMAFMLYLSLLIMKDAQSGVINSMAKASTSDSGVFGRVVVGGVTLAIPIALLWIGMLSAQKMGAFGAGAVVGQATKAAKWAGKKFSGYNWGKRRVDAFNAERKKRADEKFKGNLGEKFGKLANRGQDWMHGHLRKGDAWYGGIPGSKGARKRYNKMNVDENNKKINDGAEDLIKGGTSAATIVGSSGTTFGRNNAKNGKIDDAKQARAYIKMDFSERKDFIDADVRGRTASAGVQNIINITAAELGITDPAAVAAHLAEQATVAAIAATGATNNAEVARVNRFVNNQMNAVVRKGSNA